MRLLRAGAADLVLEDRWLPGFVPRVVEAADYLGVLWTDLTEARCAEVFAATREHERMQFTLVKFWIALLRDGPEVRTTARGHPPYPVLTATPEPPFERVQAGATRRPARSPSSSATG